MGAAVVSSHAATFCKDCRAKQQLSTEGRAGCRWGQPHVAVRQATDQEKLCCKDSTGQSWVQLGAATRSCQAGHSRTLTWGRRTPPRALSDGKCKSEHGAAAAIGPDSVWRRTGRRKELLHLVSVALVPRPDAEGGGGQMALGVPARLPREPHCSCEEIAATRVHANDDAVVIHAQASGPCMAAQRSGRNGVAGSCVPHQPYPS